MTRLTRTLIAAAAVGAAILPSTGVAAVDCTGTNTTWTGASSSAWGTPGNWSAGVPKTTDAVCIPDVANDPAFSSPARTIASVVADPASSLTVSGTGLTVTGAATLGTLTVTGGTVTLSGTSTITTLAQSGGTLTGSGAVTLGGGTWSGGTWSGSGAVTVPLGASLTVSNATTAGTPGRSVTNAGTITLSSGATFAVPTLQNTGVLRGLGTSTVGGSVTNTGTTRIGDVGVAGKLTITGAYTQGAAGRLEVDVVGNGGVAGTNQDWLAVTQAATLDGTLAVTTTPGINQSAAANLTVLTTGAGLRTGQFATFTGRVGQPGGLYTPQYGGSSVVLAYTPASLSVTAPDTITLGTLALGHSATAALPVEVRNTYRAGYTLSVQQTGTVDARLPLGLSIPSAPAGTSLLTGTTIPVTTATSTAFGRRTGTVNDELGVTTTLATNPLQADTWGLSLTAGPLGWAPAGATVANTLTFTVVSP